MADVVELSRSVAHPEVALIKANAAELTAMETSARTVHEGRAISEDDNAALLHRDDTAQEAGE